MIAAACIAAGVSMLAGVAASSAAAAAGASPAIRNRCLGYGVAVALASLTVAGLSASAERYRTMSKNKPAPVVTDTTPYDNFARVAPDLVGLGWVRVGETWIDPQQVAALEVVSSHPAPGTPDGMALEFVVHLNGGASVRLAGTQDDAANVLCGYAPDPDPDDEIRAALDGDDPDQLTLTPEGEAVGADDTAPAESESEPAAS